ncbi:MAG: DUF5698 domain-containing protein [Chloroflexi bacterium]|nr:DUF5698 domain-containing protein [Chloroflexota bacterium]
MEVIATAVAIFALRVIGNMLTTMRLVMIARSKLKPAFVLSVFESLVFALALGVVVTNLNSIPNLIAYSVGFATGGYLAMRLEEHLLPYFIEVTAISVTEGHRIAEAIREEGMGATEHDAHGARGNVCVVQSVIERRQLKKCLTTIYHVDPNAFVSTTALRGTEHGYLSVQPGLSRLFSR